MFIEETPPKCRSKNQLVKSMKFHCANINKYDCQILVNTVADGLRDVVKAKEDATKH